MQSLVTLHDITPERQWYLFDKTREYCLDASRDITYPSPLVPQISTPCQPPEPVVHQETMVQLLKSLFNVDIFVPCMDNLDTVGIPVKYKET